MHLRVNGELREVPTGCTVSQLLELLEIRVKHVAVERNGLIAPRATHAELELTEGDELEVVTLVGGG